MHAYEQYLPFIIKGKLATVNSKQSSYCCMSLQRPLLQ